jgi:CcmD family protein
MDITNLHFLFYGYSAAFLILFGFVLLLVSRGRRIDREIDRLKSLLEEREAEREAERAAEKGRR